MQRLNYIGRSMLPTFLPADRIGVVPYKNLEEVRCGDIIVFQSFKNSFITHRVVSVGRQGIKTRGDNNRSDDGQILNFKDVIGKVVEVKRRGKIRRIPGGRPGFFYGIIIHNYCAVRRVLSGLLRRPYHLLSKINLFKKIFRRFFKYRIICYHHFGRTEFQLAFGNRVIGRYLPSRKQLQLKPPFKLFIDEMSLPLPLQHAR